MLEQVDKKLRNKIDRIELERNTYTWLYYSSMIVLVTYLSLIGFYAGHIKIFLLITIIVISIICIYAINLLTEWHSFTNKTLYYCFGYCGSKILIQNRHRHESKITIKLPDNSLLKNTSVHFKLGEKCDVDDPLILIFDENNSNDPIKIYRLKQTKPTIALYRW